MPSRNDPDPGANQSRIPGGFRAAFASALAGVGLRVTDWQGTSVRCEDAEGHDRTLSLDNLYRRAQNIDRSEWAALIAEFVQNITEATAENVLPEDLNAAADQLMPRVGQPFPKSMGEHTPWFKRLGESGLVTNIVIDHPQFMAYAVPALIEKSGRTGDDWHAVACDNLRRATPADYLTPISEDVDIRIGCCGDAYDAARALIIDDLFTDPLPFGCFLAVPARDVLVALPVSPDTLIHVHVLRRFAEDNFSSKPYPISDEVYWVRRGEWFRFPVEITKETVQVTPPDEFIDEVLSNMPDEGAEGENSPG